MRNTVSVDSDPAISRERRDRGPAAKGAALSAVGRTAPLPLGRLLVADVDDVAHLLDVVDGEEHR